ncbi:MAG: hypothetical protein E7625_03540 [Ruminococcaceae bacterium]|nr:hypothetical protein [Oscillospiraceae bacterium]
MRQLKIFCFLMTILMLLGTLLACKPDSNTPGGNQENPSTDGASKEEQVLHSFERVDYKGDIFMIAASSTYENRFTIDQFAVDDEYNGNIVHDALFYRDTMIEEYFHINIEYDDVLDSQIAAHVSPGIRTGDDEYSLILANLGNAARKLFDADLLRNLYDFEDIDFSKPWWNRQSVENFELNGKIFMATGAITNRYVYAPYAMLFNTRLIGELSLENPYDMVESGDWTLENFKLMIEDTYNDDGNDVVDLEDFYGLAPASDSETAYYFACGGRMVKKDGDELIPVYEDGPNVTLLQLVIDMYDTDDVLKFKETYDSNATFKDGRAIFHSTALCDITMLANMEDKYGIVPMPKYDEDQENYISNANSSISTMAVLPITVRDTKKVGTIVEALAAVSQYTSLDKQYDNVLLLRQALDEKSKLNLQRVVESVSYDWGYMFDIAQVKTKIAQAILKSNMGVADDYTSVRDVFNGALAEIVARFYYEYTEE